MPRFPALAPVLALTLIAPAFGSDPVGRAVYEDRTGPGGHTLVVDGRTFGPYRELRASVASTSGSAVAFAGLKKDRLVVVAQGKEWGPLPLGYELDRLQVADDGRVWILTATRVDGAADTAGASLLVVNGRAYGPYTELTSVEYAETGGAWIAAVRTSEAEADVLLSGRSQGPFYSVDHAWMGPDGKNWGFAVSDSEERQAVTTDQASWPRVVESNFSWLYPREPHWGFSLTLPEGEQRISVDGVWYEGYQGFRGLILTPSGRHWGFEALRVADATPVVVVDGREFPGTDLSWSRLGVQESFLWNSRDDVRVQVKVLKLP